MRQACFIEFIIMAPIASAVFHISLDNLQLSYNLLVR